MNMSERSFFTRVSLPGKIHIRVKNGTARCEPCEHILHKNASSNLNRTGWWSGLSGRCVVAVCVFVKVSVLTTTQIEKLKLTFIL